MATLARMDGNHGYGCERYRHDGGLDSLTKVAARDRCLAVARVEGDAGLTDFLYQRIERFLHWRELIQRWRERVEWLRRE